jgi:NDP-sugar pyrophosphorylase family protein
MKAVILAGGLGMRLRPFTEVIPKPLLPIGERAIMEIQIEQLRKHGFDEIYVACNYKSDYVERFLGDGAKYGVKLTVSKEEIPLGTVGPLTLLRDRLTEPFLVMNGDILTRMDFARFHGFALDNKASLTVAIKRLLLPFAFGNIFFDGHMVTGIEEKPDLVTWVLAGIYVMTPAVFDMIPAGRRFNMDEMIRNMLAQGRPVVKYEMEEYWLDIGQIEDYTKAQKEYEAQFREADAAP